MRRSALFAAPLAAIAVLALTGSAVAGEKAKEGGGGSKPDMQKVDISSVALPIVWRGRLLNYVFAQVRIDLTPRADPTKLREKEPYLRDALVRAGHATPLHRDWDFVELDVPTLKRVFLPQVERILGPGQVAGLTVVSQTPKVRSGLPQPPKPAGAPPADAPPPV